MPLTSRAITIVAALAVLTACGSDAGADRTDPADAAARAQAAEALDRVASLTDRVERLGSELRDQERAQRRLADGIETRLGVLAERLREALDAVRVAAESAGADADAAEAQIGGIARNLSVLKERFDYHLRNGGG
jgi:hypothetical protein